jgi:2-hydroxy-3-keto-5-methylthiopentenyl-1-phosphate phosphatase
VSLARAPLPPADDEAPLSLLIDYDGTVTQLDVGDELLRRFVDSPEVARLDELYAAGALGSRELMRWDMDVLPRDPRQLRSAARQIPLDPAFAAFVALAREAKIAVEVVSDGLGFYVRPSLRRLGLADLPVATNENRLGGGGSGMTFPFGHLRCSVCGTCKRARVQAHQGVGRAVIFIGDGASDRYAAFHADLVFAKDQLADLCRAEDWPFRGWRDFAELSGVLAGLLRTDELPRTAASLEGWRATHPSAARRAESAGAPGYVCGPEAWGPDRSSPPGAGLSRP